LYSARLRRTTLQSAAIFNKENDLGFKEAGLEKETEERKWLMSIHPANRMQKRGINYFERTNKFSQKSSEVKICGKESED
jgi:hypothetical protein